MAGTTSNVKHWSFRCKLFQPGFGVTRHKDYKIKMMSHAHCLLLGYVNRQTFSSWCQGNPSEMHKSPKVSPPICTESVVYHLPSSLDLIYLRTGQQERVTLNARSDGGMLMNFLGPKMHCLYTQNVCFITSHTANISMNMLQTSSQD
jgi:hypothetical protein